MKKKMTLEEIEAEIRGVNEARAYKYETHICGNCHIPMYKTVDPIIFGTARHPHTRWKCDQCGADLPRYEGITSE